MSFDSDQALQAAGLRDVIAERIDQIDRHGFTLAHDRGHHPGNLALGAASYLNTAIDQLHGKHCDPKAPADTWPWEREAWRPGDARANIVKALAIGLAVLDRIDHAARDAGDDLPGLFDASAPAPSLPADRHANRWPKGVA